MLNRCIRGFLHPGTKSLFRSIHTTPIRSGGEWLYRQAPVRTDPQYHRIADVLGSFLWYWIIYHCITQYEHITGEFEYPDPTKWTDAELGIPPDEED